VNKFVFIGFRGERSPNIPPATDR